MRNFLFQTQEFVLKLFSNKKKIAKIKHEMLQQKKMAIETFEKEKKHIQFYSVKKRYKKA